MRTLFLTAVLVVQTNAVLAQVTPVPPDPSAAVQATSADSTFTEAVLRGGLEDLANRIRYPDAARAARIQGTVFVQFNVHADGTTSDYRIQQSPSELLSGEAIRVVRESEFNPATKDGLPVKVQYTLPVRFVL